MPYNLFAAVGASLFALALVWALVLGWWQANDFQPSPLDLMLYLGALPLALLGGFWLLRGFIEHLRTPAPAPEAPPVDEDPLLGAAARTAAAERGLTLALIGHALASPAGDEAAAVLAALAGGQRPGPDLVLHGADGFAAFAARHPDIDAEDLLARLEAAHAPLAAMLTGAAPRALALLEAALPPLLAQAGELLADRPAARLRITWVVDAGWPHEWRPALRQWLRSELLAELDAERIELVLAGAASDADGLQLADELILGAHREHLLDDLHLLAGAGSLLDDATVARLAARDELFGTRTPSGRIPGECAMALLMTGEAQDATGGIDAPVRVSRTLRAGHADAAQRVPAALTAQLATGLLTAHGLEADAIGAVVADADHRDCRTGELMTMLGEVFAALDPAEDCLAIGAVCGSTAPLGALLALGCAAHLALENEAAALCVSNQDDRQRAACLVLPPTTDTYDASSDAESDNRTP